MKNTMGKRHRVLPVILGMFVITACIIGCSGKKAETAAPKENAEIIVEQAEVIIESSVTEPVVVVEEIQPEQVVTAPVEEEPAEKPAAPTAPQQPAAPKYAIGDKGPGGGLVFSVSGGKYKEMYIAEKAVYSGDEDVTVANAGRLLSEWKFKYGTYSDWKAPTIQELRQFYEIIIAAGKARFGEKLVSSQTEVGKPISSAPGYFMYYAGGGDSYYYFTLNDGKIWTEGTYRAEKGDAAWNAVPLFWAIVRSF